MSFGGGAEETRASQPLVTCDVLCVLALLSLASVMQGSLVSVSHVSGVARQFSPVVRFLCGSRRGPLGDESSCCVSRKKTIFQVSEQPPRWPSKACWRTPRPSARLLRGCLASAWSEKNGNVRMPRGWAWSGPLVDKSVMRGDILHLLHAAV